MGCCKGSNSVFNQKDTTTDPDAIRRTMSDAVDNPTHREKTFKHDSTTRSLPNASFSSTPVEEDIPPCEYRSFSGTTSVGSKKIAVYNCKKYDFTVHKSHCLKCPFIKIAGAVAPASKKD